ncbi:hypothetical protein [Chromobacterium subtsugae]|nr:hypothetical protein [Chromobacterium subtsugae]
MEFLDGLRVWFMHRTGAPLTNAQLAEVAMVSQNTAESWRTAPGLATHRALSTRDRVLILLRLANLAGSRRPGNARLARWSLAEDQIICAHYAVVGAVGLVSQLPGRSAEAISIRAGRLGVAGRDCSAL